MHAVCLPLITVCVCRGNLDKRLTTLEAQLNDCSVRKVHLNKVFVGPKRRVMNKFEPQKKRARHKKKKKNRRNRQSSPLGGILDSQCSLGSLFDSQAQMSQEEEQAAQQLSQFISQDNTPASDLNLTLSPPAASSPIRSVEIPPNDWDKVSIPFPKELLTRVRGNINLVLHVMDGQKGLSEQVLAGCMDVLQTVQWQAEQMARILRSDEFQPGFQRNDE